MSKLLKKDKFIDVADYGRFLAKLLVHLIINTKITPIHLTFLFGVSGVIAIWCIHTSHFLLAGIFLVLKSVIDAADGELARVKNTPSYTGRYLDSIFDFVLNFFILLSIAYITNSSYWLFVAAFLSMQMQGTLYNYYYVILRNKLQGGDTTSKIFEHKEPKAFEGEAQWSVKLTYQIFNILYSFFDKTIYWLDKNALKAKAFPNWFMSAISVFGLGFQLLLIAILLNVNCVPLILPIFIMFNFLLFVFLIIRKKLL